MFASRTLDDCKPLHILVPGSPSEALAIRDPMRRILFPRPTSGLESPVPLGGRGGLQSAWPIGAAIVQRHAGGDGVGVAKTFPTGLGALDASTGYDLGSLPVGGRPRPRSERLCIYPRWRQLRVRPRTIESEIVEYLMERLLSSWPAGNW